MKKTIIISLICIPLLVSCTAEDNTSENVNGFKYI